MAGGWARDGAVQEQIDASVEDAVRKARDRIATGPGRSHCEGCESLIPDARRSAIPGVRLCVTCQEEEDAEAARQGGINRRGSKDSQLR